MTDGRRREMESPAAGRLDMHCLRCQNDSTTDLGVCQVCGGPLEKDPDRYFKAGMEAMSAGEIDLCTRLLGDCVKLNPDHLSGRYNLGIALCLANQCDEAVEQYVAVMEREPDYPGVYTALGQAAFGDYLYHMEQADSNRRAMFQFLKKAVEQDPTDVDAYFSLGNACIAVGSAAEALSWLHKAMKFHPDSSAIYFAAAKAYKMLRRRSEAVAMAKMAMELSGPKDPLAEEINALFAEIG